MTLARWLQPQAHRRPRYAMRENTKAADAQPSTECALDNSEKSSEVVAGTLSADEGLHQGFATGWKLSTLVFGLVVCTFLTGLVR
jgi:hypothetical protein